MLLMLSLTCVAVISVTGSELNMSVMNSDRNKALMAAKAGAEAAAQHLDDMVGQIQEKSRLQADIAVQNEIDTCTTGSAFDGIIDKITHVVINEEAQKKIDQFREDKFKDEFNREIRDELSDYIQDLKSYSSIQMGGTNAFYFYPGDKIEPLAESTVIENDLKTVSTTVTGIRLVSTGQSEKIKRSIRAEFSFLDKKSVGTEVPVTYGNLTQLSVKGTKNKNDILNDKALVAKGNIISIGGKATIDGDVCSFGTIPVGTDGKEKLSEDSGYEYGGIMAGITQKVWDDDKIINKSTIKNLLKKDDTYFTDKYGSLQIKGNASTMSYVHSLFALAEAKTDIGSGADSDTSASAISITGHTYARAVSLEKEARGSLMKLQNVYVTDDVRIQSDKSLIEIGGWNSDGSDNPALSGTAIGLQTGTNSDPRSSAIVVGGASQLWINGSVYMGGTAMFNEYTDQTPSKSNYISGISVLKSDSMPADAFKLYDISGITTRPAFTFPNNIFYLFKNDDYNPDNSTYISVHDPDVTNEYTLQTEKYDFKPEIGTESEIDMMKGYITPAGIGIDFDVVAKAMHFKYIWDKFWGNDNFIDSIKYYAKVGTEDIKITTDNNGDIVGWCSGAVAANGTIYGPFKYNRGKGFTGKTVGEYIAKARNAGKDYLNKMNLFINSSAITYFDTVNELKDNVKPQMSISQSALNVDTSKDDQMSVTANPFFFQSSGNVVLGKDPSTGDDSIQTDTGFSQSRPEGYKRGIIYSGGDIYVRTGTDFRGILIAEGNIVFLGDSSVTYDQDVVDTLIARDMNVSKFFKTTIKTIDLEHNPIKTTRLANVKNIKIKLWKEI